jgi:hypothetical protein
MNISLVTIIQDQEDLSLLDQFIKFHIYRGFDTIVIVDNLINMTSMIESFDNPNLEKEYNEMITTFDKIINKYCNQNIKIIKARTKFSSKQGREIFHNVSTHYLDINIDEVNNLSDYRTFNHVYTDFDNTMISPIGKYFACNYLIHEFMKINNIDWFIIIDPDEYHFDSEGSIKTSIKQFINLNPDMGAFKIDRYEFMDISNNNCEIPIMEISQRLKSSNFGKTWYNTNAIKCLNVNFTALSHWQYNLLDGFNSIDIIDNVITKNCDILDSITIKLAHYSIRTNYSFLRKIFSLLKNRDHIKYFQIYEKAVRDLKSMKGKHNYYMSVNEMIYFNNVYQYLSRRISRLCIDKMEKVDDKQFINLFKWE